MRKVRIGVRIPTITKIRGVVDSGLLISWNHLNTKVNVFQIKKKFIWVSGLWHQKIVKRKIMMIRTNTKKRKRRRLVKRMIREPSGLRSR
jgi:hypothetical protein